MQFTTADDIKACARIVEEFQKRQIAVGFHGVEHTMVGAGNTTHPVLKSCLERLVRIDVERRSETLSQFPEVELFAIQDTVSAGKAGQCGEVF